MHARIYVCIHAHACICMHASVCMCVARLAGIGLGGRGLGLGLAEIGLGGRTHCAGEEVRCLRDDSDLTTKRSQWQASSVYAVDHDGARLEMVDTQQCEEEARLTSARPADDAHLGMHVCNVCNVCNVCM